MGSVCAQGFPKGNTEAPSLCCISQNTECCTSEHDMGSRASCANESCWVCQAAGLCQACDERRVYVIFLLCWKLCVIGKCQSCFWLRIATDVWRKERGIASVKGSETCHCLTLVWGLGEGGS